MMILKFTLCFTTVVFNTSLATITELLLTVYVSLVEVFEDCAEEPVDTTKFCVSVTLSDKYISLFFIEVFLTVVVCSVVSSLTLEESLDSLFSFELSSTTTLFTLSFLTLLTISLEFS